MTYKLQLSRPQGEIIRTIIEQPNELIAVLTALQAYPGFKVDSVATMLLYPLRAKRA